MEELIKETELQRLSVEIKRNIDGIAIIEIFDTGNKKLGDCLVDDNMYYDLTKYKWSNGNGYAKNSKLGRMHRHILKYTGDKKIDHRNNNKLDNRLSNLRICEDSLNSHNRQKSDNLSSSYIGVNYNKKSGKYKSSINKDNITYYLGLFDSQEIAAKFRDFKAIELYGEEHAKLNFPIDVILNDESLKNIEMPKSPNRTSKYNGVSLPYGRKKFVAYISKNKDIYNLGSFENEEDAARAFDAKLIELKKNRSKLNFPDEHPITS